MLPLVWFVITRRVAHWVTVLLLLGLMCWLGRQHPGLWRELLPPREPLSPAVATSTLPAAANSPAANPPAASHLRPARFSDWLQRWQAYLGLATLTIALLVWFGEVHEDWVESRPKLMTCLFLFQGRPVIVCRHVDLASPGDLRAWAQQVCAQTVGARFLDFYPSFHICRPRLGRLRRRSPSRSPGGGAWLRHAITGDDLRQHFVIQFHLRSDGSGKAWRTPDTCHYLNAADSSSPQARPIPLREVGDRLQTLLEWSELRQAAKRYSSIA